MECILFDLDGTIQDSETLATEANRFAFREVLGRDITGDELEELTGKPVPAVLARLFPEQGSRILEAGIRYYMEQVHRIRCYPGVKELLLQLAAEGCRLGLVSSKPRRFIEPELEAGGLRHLFECLVGQEDTPVHKPEPAPLLLAAGRMRLDPARTLYIGDQPSDIVAAQRAGMQSAAALWGEGTAARLLPAGPALVFDAPAAVLGWYRQACRPSGASPA